MHDSTSFSDSSPDNRNDYCYWSHLDDDDINYEWYEHMRYMDGIEALYIDFDSSTDEDMFQPYDEEEPATLFSCDNGPQEDHDSNQAQQAADAAIAEQAIHHDEQNQQRLKISESLNHLTVLDFISVTSPRNTHWLNPWNQRALHGDRGTHHTAA